MQRMLSGDMRQYSNNCNCLELIITKIFWAGEYYCWHYLEFPVHTDDKNQADFG